MRKKTIVSLLMVVVLTLGLYTSVALTATEAEIEASIDAGIAWLVNQQNADGSWGSFEHVAKTAFAVVKLEDRAFELGFDPFDIDYPYSGNVIAGFSYIFDHAFHSECGDGNTIIFKTSGHETYNTGIVMMAIAASRSPDRVVNAPGSIVHNLTFKSIMQATVDYFQCAQNPDGAWRYWYKNEPSDNSNTGYAVLGLSYAEEFGVIVPQSVKDKLSAWIDYIQNDTSGGSGYTSPNNWVNVLKTGNLIYEMIFVGDDPSEARFQKALEYIENHWKDTGVGIYDEGWGFNSSPAKYQAMYCLMKGLESSGIDLIDTDGDGVRDDDWFNQEPTDSPSEDLASVLVDQQNPDGSWTGCAWSYDDNVVCTEWALLTLEKVVPVKRVSVDIKPTSCPNPINTKSNGVLPVAILGEENLDVTDIDPASVLLEGVAPLRWNWEDVAAPYIPGMTPEEPQLACTTEGPDGYMDLTLKFKVQELLEALGDLNDGQVLMLLLEGELKEEFGSTSFLGEDVVIILDKAKGKPMSSAFALRQVLATPNPVSSADHVYFSVVGEGIVAMELKVFSLAGAKLFESGSVAGTSYSWDLASSSGDRLANGLYLAVITAEGLDSSSESKVLKLFVVR